jgi:galactokinase
LAETAVRQGQTMQTQERQAWLSEKFTQTFSAPPEIIGRAPGRVDLMGSHTDYNLGYVMTMTIDRDTWIAARPRQEGKVRIYSLNVSGGGSFRLDHLQHTKGWLDYVQGMAWALQQAGHSLTGFDALVHSSVPFGSGLSSSAALEMSCGVIFQALSGFHLDPVEMALVGQKAENQFVGVNCGILDQYSSALGRAGSTLLLDCRNLTHRITPIDPTVCVVICDTCAERHLLGSEYGDRRAQCETGVRLLQRYYPGVQALRDVSLEMLEAHRGELTPVVYRRCQFIVEENQRVLDMAAALACGDRSLLAALLRASYEGARDLYEIGAPAMEAMAQAMWGSPGAIGGRQAGAGFGGCMVALVERTRVSEFAACTEETYHARTGLRPMVYAVEPAPGAGILSL